MGTAHVLLNLSLLLLTWNRVLAAKITHAVLTVGAHSPIAVVDSDFVCATLDWWPPEKCDYGTCSWGNASLLDLNLTHPMLINAVIAFAPLKIRLGGSLQDQVIYNVGQLQEPCVAFSKSNAMFGFSGGCLTMSRWNELIDFFQRTKSKVVFGVNALYGRVKHNGHYSGAWNSSNAHSFIQYTVDNKFEIAAWEFGNELSGSGVGTSILAEQYAADVHEFRKIINEIYAEHKHHPLIVAPDGFFNKTWSQIFMKALGPNMLNVFSIHIYNLGSGKEANLVQNILDPSYLDRQHATFSGLEDMLKSTGYQISSWVGEAGGAYNSGQHLVTDAFVSSFWYLDQMGMAARYGVKTHCRQSLVGGNYGLLNATNFKPNPDYYSALLWHRLMGKKVLSANSITTTDLRTYSHCSKDKAGISLVILNLSNTTKYHVSASIQAPPSESSDGVSLKLSLLTLSMTNIICNLLKARADNGVSQYKVNRFEYHLTPKDGNIQSQIVYLNGKELLAIQSQGIPRLDPKIVDNALPISVAPLSIVFVTIPGQYPSCIP